MFIRLRSIWEVRVFSVTLTALVILCTFALQHVLMPRDLVQQVRWPGALIAFMLAAPLTYFVGLRMHDIHRLNVDMNETARHDPLTGLLTRPAFFERTRRSAQFPGVVIMADIDHFKKYNDTHGHAVGDAALKQVALVLREFCRAEDLAARFGGEEFMIFLPATTLDDGAGVAERLRARLAQTPVRAGDQVLVVRASFGVAAVPRAQTIEEAIARADAALYRAKGQGRNRVCVDPQEEAARHG